MLPAIATPTRLMLQAQVAPLHIQFSMELSLNCSAAQWLLISLEVSLGTGQLTTQVGVYSFKDIYRDHHALHANVLKQ